MDEEAEVPGASCPAQPLGRRWCPAGSLVLVGHSGTASGAEAQAPPGLLHVLAGNLGT